MDIASKVEKDNGGVATQERKNVLRRLYDWVLHWAETPHGAWALFILAFAESSFFPIPPDALLIAMCISVRQKSFRFALICSLGSILGGMFGYFIGFGLWHLVDNFFFNYIPGFSEERFIQTKQLYEQWDFLIVFTAGFTFIPYKIFTVSSGVFDINFIGFLLASTISRSARFFLVSSLIWKFGEPVKNFIDKYFDYLAVLFILLLIGGFVLAKYAF